MTLRAHTSQPRVLPHVTPRWWVRWAVITCLSLATAVTAACKREPDKVRDQRPGRRGAAAVQLPEPLPVPDQPRAAIHLADPGALFDELARWIPLDRNRVVAGVLREQTTATVADTIAPHIDLHGPWDTMRVETDEILHLPMSSSGIDAVSQALAQFPQEGDFGARRLPPRVPDGSGRLAYLDAAAGTLTIADSLRGLATGPALASVAKAEIWATLDGEIVRGLARGDFPFTGVEVRGTGPRDLLVTVSFDPKQAPKTQLVPGALTGLLAAPKLAIGGTARWSEHRAWVQQTIAQLKRQVDKAGFAAQMVLGKLVSQASTLLRSWNGKVFAGAGPKGHLVFGFGCDDPAKAKRAALGTLNTAISNLSLLRMFTNNAPQLGLRKVGSGHVLTVVGVKNSLGPELAPLLDDRGRLRIAFSSDVRVGALYGVVGADAASVLDRWSATLASAPSAADAGQHLAAAKLAVDSTALAPLLQRPSDGNFNPGPVLDLEASQPPITLTIQQFASHYELRLTGK